MKRLLAKIIVCILVITSMISYLVGCGNTQKNVPANNKTSAAVKSEPVKLKFPIWRVGAATDAPYEAKILDNFKKTYDGQIELQIEELPSNQAYVDKMKILMASGDVPDVVSGNGGILELAAKSKLFVDLKPYLDADPEWKDAVGEQAIQTNTREGKLVSVSESRSVAGYYYNKEMFDKAGIKPATTWDEWFTNLDKLKATGVIPVALMTGENSWTTNLILASMVATSGDAGNKFMNTTENKNYEIPEFVNALKNTQKMFKQYTSKDALGATYNIAANNFLSGKVAIIANGIWMVSDFSNKEKAIEGLDKKVGISVYPGGGVFCSCDPGFMVLSKDKVRADAAVKLVKAHSDLFAQTTNLELNGNFPLSSKVQVTDAIKQKNPLMAELMVASANAKWTYKFPDDVSYPSVTNEFSQLYPALAMDKITPEEMAKKLTEIASKNN